MHIRVTSDGPLVLDDGSARKPSQNDLTKTKVISATYNSQNLNDITGWRSITNAVLEQPDILACVEQHNGQI